MLKNFKEKKINLIKDLFLVNLKRVSSLLNQPIYNIAIKTNVLSFPVEILENIKNDLQKSDSNNSYEQSLREITTFLTEQYSVTYNELSHFNKKATKKLSGINIQAKYEKKQLKGKIIFNNKNNKEIAPVFFELKNQYFLDKNSIQDLLDLNLTKKEIIVFKEFLKLFSYHEARSSYAKKELVIDTGFLYYIDNSFSVTPEQKETLTNIFFIAAIHQIEEFSLGRELYGNRISHKMLIEYLKKHQQTVRQYYLMQEKYLLHLEMKKYHQQKNLRTKKQERTRKEI